MGLVVALAQVHGHELRPRPPLRLPAQQQGPAPLRRGAAGGVGDVLVEGPVAGAGGVAGGEREIGEAGDGAGEVGREGGGAERREEGVDEVEGDDLLEGALLLARLEVRAPIEPRLLDPDALHLRSHAAEDPVDDPVLNIGEVAWSETPAKSKDREVSAGKLEGSDTNGVPCTAGGVIITPTDSSGFVELCFDCVAQGLYVCHLHVERLTKSSVPSLINGTQNVRCPVTQYFIGISQPVQSSESNYLLPRRQCGSKLRKLQQLPSRIYLFDITQVCMLIKFHFPGNKSFRLLISGNSVHVHRTKDETIDVQIWMLSAIHFDHTKRIACGNQLRAAEQQTHRRHHSSTIKHLL